MSEKNCCQLCGGPLNRGYCPSCGFYAKRKDKMHYRLNESNASRRLDSGYDKTLKKQLERREKSHQHLHNDFKGTSSEVIKARREAEAKKQAQQRAGTGHSLGASITAGNMTSAAKNAVSYAKTKATSLASEFDKEFFDGSLNIAKKTQGGSYQMSSPTAGKTTWNTASRPRNTMQSKKSGFGPLTVVVVIAAIIAAGAIIIGQIGSSIPDDPWVDNSTSEPAYEYDPYASVKEMLPETGDDFTTVLTGGEYIVGVHIPEGLYQISLEEGSGSLNVDDYNNGYSTYKWFEITDEEDEEDHGYITELSDVPLLNGAHFTVYPDVTLFFETSNAQTANMYYIDNPLTEPVYVSKGETMRCGVNFEPGVYDVYDVEDDSLIFYTYPAYWSDEGEFFEELLWLSPNEGLAYQNLVLVEGAEIYSDDGNFVLVPSPEIGDIDYSTYYDREW